MPRMTAADLDAYMTAHPGQYPDGPEPGTWLEPCAWCEEPTACDDGAPDRGRPFCSPRCAADSKAWHARVRHAD
jgi:hypothetical protein